MEMPSDLVSKYKVVGPRYTSYPTVPYWNKDKFSLKAWKSDTLKSFEERNVSEGISLYIHLPFCESLCTFCGCNKRITKNHGVETPYLESVLKEFQSSLKYKVRIVFRKRKKTFGKYSLNPCWVAAGSI